MYDFRWNANPPVTLDGLRKLLKACEQAFAWMDQFCPYLLEMGPGLFSAHVTMMMDRRNAHIVAKRKKGSEECGCSLSAKALRSASRARFEQLKLREVTNQGCP